MTNMINQNIQHHHLDTTILSTEPNGIMVWTHHHKSLQEKTYQQPIVSENKNDPQHKKILQSKQNIVPENKNDRQHTQILQSKPIFVPENKNDPQHTNFSCQIVKS
jgi:hypothetical protein